MSAFFWNRDFKNILLWVIFFHSFHENVIQLNEIKNIELDLQKEENYQDLNKINELNVKLQNLKKSTTKYQGIGRAHV